MEAFLVPSEQNFVCTSLTDFEYFFSFDKVFLKKGW